MSLGRSLLRLGLLIVVAALSGGIGTLMASNFSAVKCGIDTTLQYA